MWSLTGHASSASRSRAAAVRLAWVLLCACQAWTLSGAMLRAVSVGDACVRAAQVAAFFVQVRALPCSNMPCAPCCIYVHHRCLHALCGNGSPSHLMPTCCMQACMAVVVDHPQPQQCTTLPAACARSLSASSQRSTSSKPGTSAGGFSTSQAAGVPSRLQQAWAMWAAWANSMPVLVAGELLQLVLQVRV